MRAIKIYAMLALLVLISGCSQFDGMNAELTEKCAIAYMSTLQTNLFAQERGLSYDENMTKLREICGDDMIDSFEETYPMEQDISTTNEVIFKDVDYTVIVTIWGNSTVGTPYDYKKETMFDCRDIADDAWKYPTSYDEVFNSAYEYCNETFPGLINYTEPEPIYFMGNLTMGNTLNITGPINWYGYDNTNYEFYGIDNSTFNFHNMTCYQVTCDCFPCMVYCMKCFKVGAES